MPMPWYALTQEKWRKSPQGFRLRVPKCVLFFLSPVQHGLSATYHASISTIFEKKTWISVRMHTLVKSFRIFVQGVFQVPKTDKNWGACARGTAQMAKFQQWEWEVFWGLVDSQRMCLLYMSFGGGLQFWRYKPTKNPNFGNCCCRLHGVLVRRYTLCCLLIVSWWNQSRKQWRLQK